uniref:Uncharacterized protein n=1 Tax=uncultured Thiotrichaceae bacterium TaxID=298394 RepID=A0A6S6UJP0_9GAMM|nr:MAG: Unknown protein [uncultured Thiotrichaceae bacterium]
MFNAKKVTQQGFSTIRNAPYYLALALCNAIALSFFFVPTLSSVLGTMGVGFAMALFLYYYWQSASPLLFFVGLLLMLQMHNVLGYDLVEKPNLWFSIIHSLAVLFSALFIPLVLFKKNYVNMLNEKAARTQ